MAILLIIIYIVFFYNQILFAYSKGGKYSGHQHQWSQKYFELSERKREERKREKRKEERRMRGRRRKKEGNMK